MPLMAKRVLGRPARLSRSNRSPFVPDRSDGSPTRILQLERLGGLVIGADMGRGGGGHIPLCL